MKDYSDIIDLPYRKSRRRVQMSMEERAAQFSPFASLKGYEDLIDEEGRYVGERREPSEESKNRVNAELTALKLREKDHPLVALTYFAADEKKAGGTYRTVVSRLVKLSDYEQTLSLSDLPPVSYGDIVGVEEVRSEEE